MTVLVANVLLAMLTMIHQSMESAASPQSMDVSIRNLTSTANAITKIRSVFHATKDTISIKPIFVLKEYLWKTVTIVSNTSILIGKESNTETGKLIALSSVLSVKIISTLTVRTNANLSPKIVSKLMERESVLNVKKDMNLMKMDSVS